MNGLANDGLITTLQTIVGRWPPCHVLQHPIYVIIMEDGYHYGGRLSHGGRGAETLVLLSLLCLAFFFALRWLLVGLRWLLVGLRWLLVGLRCLLLGFVPSLVGRWSPCHVLQQAK